MICNFCGNKIDDASEFCVICGQKATDEKTQATNENVFSQAEQEPVVEAPVVVEEAVEVAPEEVVTDTAEAIATVEAPEEVEDGKKDKKGKKAKKAKKPVGFFMRILCFISTIISLLTYSKAVKKANVARKESVLNLLGLSICWKLAGVVVYLVITFVL